jgi:hypothetical protein
MTDTLLLLNWALSVVVFAHGLAKRSGYLEYPFLASVVYIGWYLPQASALASGFDPSRVRLDTLLLMSLASLIAIISGWHLAIGNSARSTRAPAALTASRLIAPAIALTCAAFVIRILILVQPDSARVSQWSGLLSVLSLLSACGTVALGFSTVLIFLQRNSKTVTIFVLNIALYLPNIVYFVRRAEMSELFLIVGGSALFMRRIVVPKLMILVCVVCATMIVQATAQLRGLTGGYTLDTEGKLATKLLTVDDLASVDWTRMPSEREVAVDSEVHNAAIAMQIVDANGYLGLGTEFWNRLVHLYIPGQIIGGENKQAIMIDSALESPALLEEGAATRLGATFTGFVSPYADFSLVGALAFFLTAYALGRFYMLGMARNYLGAVLYVTTITIAMHSITHNGYYFFTSGVPVFAVVVAAMKYAASSGGRRPLRWRLVPSRES